MPAEVVFQHHLVDEAKMASPVILGQGRGEREVESKVMVRLRQILKVVFVVDFLLRPRAIPKADLAGTAWA